MTSTTSTIPVSQELGELCKSIVAGLDENLKLLHPVFIERHAGNEEEAMEVAVKVANEFTDDGLQYGTMELIFVGSYFPDEGVYKLTAYNLLENASAEYSLELSVLQVRAIALGRRKTVEGYYHTGVCRDDMNS